MRNILLTGALALCIACTQNGGWTSGEKDLVEGSSLTLPVMTVDAPWQLELLRQSCKPLSPGMIASATYEELTRKMVATVTDPSQDGVGIAGPQVGILRRVVSVQRLDKEGEPFETYPNISISAMRGEKFPGPEGCLSIPGRRADILRSRDIDITYTSPLTLRDTTERIEGFTAVIFQHECDHLDGILYTDRIGGTDMVDAEFDCPEANQGVAVDGSGFYAIGNRTIAKYSHDGSLLARMSDESFTHFDGGIVVDGQLWCSHSNYPSVPMASSIEVFDTGDLNHVGSISLGIEYGSCTWVVPGEDCWYVCFAAYDGKGGTPGQDASWTQIVQFDKSWHKMQAWILPKSLIERIRPHSLSGAVLGDGKLWCTGHDAAELFVLQFPSCGMTMVWSDSIRVPINGQGIALDKEGNLWGIDRKRHKVKKIHLL